ncbi:hypothetical protein CYLTODRAFT_222855 [Cylindrobasidium torrendii FP15055 ss-10]|uniref:Uncharacterized protein n=1 Tax=Cylindrobasidium torrendii FP15055 ss-10 TaxID=1314674 RepID=A0A0D7ASZ8_9AGAR|nr:hypothetical protein CYLTODRAFT_222855 [Cylindrobasidium torrendii FP15055 ss-10]
MSLSTRQSSESAAEANTSSSRWTTGLLRRDSGRLLYPSYVGTLRASVRMPGHVALGPYRRLRAARILRVSTPVIGAAARRTVWWWWWWWWW